MMSYLKVPKEISLSELQNRSASFSPGMYRQVLIPNSNAVKLEELLDQASPFEKGTDPGSMWYLRESDYHLIRTRALQEHSPLIYPRGDAITPINRRAFVDIGLSDHDIIMSKDSNIGEAAMVDGAGWKNYMISGGLIRLRPAADKFYLFAFIKHPIFKTQLNALTARGATIKHAGTLWLDCKIPFPVQPKANRVIEYVAALMHAVVDKERAIKDRNAAILKEIDSELSSGVSGAPFAYTMPTVFDIRRTGRLDTGLYNQGYQRFKHRVESYKGGATTLGKLGVKSRRGVNLAVSVIGKSLLSDSAEEGWYELIRPVNVSEYGTLERREWLGTKKHLPIISSGQIVLGCEGFEKGRSLVLIDAPSRCTSNFHGTVLWWPNAPLWRVIFVRCFLAFLRENGVLDWVGVGGSGGHLSPEYFEHLPFPQFPEPVQLSIAEKYHKNAAQPTQSLTLAGFVAWHQQWNKSLGIWELDRECSRLRSTLLDVQEKIIAGQPVTVPLP